MSHAKRAKQPSATAGHAPCPIVGLGASAGGLEVFSRFLDLMPSTSGIAFVLIQHLDPDRESLMASLLERHTKMPVLTVTDGMPVEPDHVYVIPPNATLTLDGEKLALVKPAPHGVRLPVDAFFRSLASERGGRAIAVVLSGTGMDGTLGLKAIKERGGIAIAQDPKDAPHDGMPRNAIANDAADEVFTVADLPAALVNYVDHPYFDAKSRPAPLDGNAERIVDDVIQILKQRENIDYGLYRKGTLWRRIERRMGIRHMTDAPAYLKLLQEDPEESERLARDFLINVSSFFRDTDVFQHLEKAILPDLVRGHPNDKPLRVWVAGCATGEEAYTYAMLLIDEIAAQKRNIKLQVFATDLDQDALSTARRGIYPEGVAGDIPPERLARFFTQEDGTYSVRPELREVVVFAEHNLLTDAPFSRMNLISCRNVLIYLESDVQDRVVQLLHFALLEQGILVLGTSETVRTELSLFDPVVSKFRIYRRRSGRGRAPTTGMMIADREVSHQMVRPASRSSTGLGDMTRRTLLDRYAPAAVLVNQKSEGLFFSGPVDRYLKVPAGEAGQNLLAMVGQDIRAALREVLRQAGSTREKALSDSLWIKDGGERRLVRITVEPLATDDEAHLLVTFEDFPDVSEPPVGSPEGTDTSIVAQMQKELEAARRELNLTIRDLQASNEELRAANEEAMSMNEEFQSTNEELETSKEELQSLNEELQTVNKQLEQKIGEERIAIDDLNNLLNSSQIATIFLDKQLRIKRFTPTTKGLFSMIATDVGRPLLDIAQKFSDECLLEDCKRVVEDLDPATVEVVADDGRWFLRRVLPYRTLSNQIDGVVITFNDITKQKQ
jgi:two-component system, chemotaxis family, CheB/CheR fusion protein